MRPPLHRPTSVVLLLLMLGTTANADAFSDEVLRQLACANPPSPVPIISALADADLINPDKNIGFDSLSCFELSKPISIAGLPVVSICGFEEEKSIRDTRPDLFYRGPGTSPGQTLSIGTRLSKEETAKWYVDTLGTKHLSAAINDDFSAVEGTVEVSCTSWFAR